MTHEHEFVKDLDGQVTCSICGAMDDEKELTPPQSKSQMKRIEIEKELRVE